MRRKHMNFEQLVKKNKEDLLDNEQEINAIELRLEKEQIDLVAEKREK